MDFKLWTSISWPFGETFDVYCILPIRFAAMFLALPIYRQRGRVESGANGGGKPGRGEAWFQAVEGGFGN